MGVWGKGEMLVYMHSSNISAAIIAKVWGVNKGTIVKELAEIPIDEGDIADGFQVMSRASPCPPVIWAWDVLSDVFLKCAIHLVFRGVVAIIV